MSRFCALVLLTAVLLPAAAHGQVGSTTDILTGVVIGMDDAPLAGAQVEAVSLETQITRRQLTDARGRYRSSFPTAAVSISSIQTDSLQRLSDSLDASNAVVRDTLHALIDRAGQRPDPALPFSRLRPWLQQARQHARDALDAAHHVLTAAQWDKLPDALKRAPAVPEAVAADQPRTSLTLWASDSGLNGFCM